MKKRITLDTWLDYHYSYILYFRSLYFGAFYGKFRADHEIRKLATKQMDLEFVV